MLRAGLLLAILLAAVPAITASAATITISGYVFRDLNADGVRDPGEPGVPGIKVRHGALMISSVTGPDGAYSLANLPTSGNVLVETGWFRTQCPATGNPGVLNCPAGPGPDNDFQAVNQFLQYPLASAKSAVNVNVGLLPDWPGDSLTPPQPPIPANAVDVAARLSSVSDHCTGGKLHICRAGDTLVATAQVYNQGTVALTGITAKLLIPVQDCLSGLSLTSTATAPGITGYTSDPATFTCATRSVRLSFAGSLVGAGAIRIRINAVTKAGPGSPGCDPAAPTSQCTSAEPMGAGWLFAVDHIDQTGDPDSTFCAAGDPRRCPTGVHDKRRNPDEVDPVGHNVSSALGTQSSMDLEAYAAVLAAPSPALRSTTVTIRAWAANQTDGQLATTILVGSTVTVYLPAGTGLGPLPSHALYKCSAGTGSGPVIVSCRYLGPLVAGLSGPALDIPATIPASWAAGTPFKVVICAAVPSGQPGTERIPAGSACGFTTNPSATTTNNDAGVSIATA
jgi:hypothetical protein